MEYLDLMKSQMYVKLRVKHEDGTKLLDGRSSTLDSLMYAILTIPFVLSPLVKSTSSNSDVASFIHSCVDSCEFLASGIDTKRSKYIFD
jgi:hypothetical protein